MYSGSIGGIEGLGRLFSSNERGEASNPVGEILYKFEYGMYPIKLDLHNRRMRLDDVMWMSRVLPRNRIVTSARLSGCGIDDVAMKALAPAIAQHAILQWVDLSNNEIGCGGLQALAGALASAKTPRLPMLDLSRNQNIDDQAIKMLAPGFRHYTGLEYLSLAWTQVKDGGVQALVLPLAQHQKLHTLDLSHNRFGVGGAQAVASMLEQHPGLRRIDLSGNRIGDAGALVLAAALDKHPGVVKLMLNGNQIGDDGARALLAALGNNRLISLELAGNMLGYQVLVQVRSMVGDNYKATIAEIGRLVRQAQESMEAGEPQQGAELFRRAWLLADVANRELCPSFAEAEKQAGQQISAADYNAKIGKMHFEAGRYVLAKETFKHVLRYCRNHQDAAQGLKLIDEDKPRPCTPLDEAEALLRYVSSHA